MKNSEKLMTAVGVVVAFVLLGVCIWVMYAARDVLAKIIVGAAGFCGTLIIASLKYTFELEKQRRHTDFLAKQANYKDLLGRIGEFARNQQGAKDALTSAHLSSWAFGDSVVIQTTNVFMKNKSRDSLVSLLKAIRRSLEQPALADDFFDTYDIDILFAPDMREGLR